MRTALNRTRTYPGNTDGAFDFPDVEPDTELVHRLRAHCDPFSPIDINAHAYAVARVVTRAKRQPLNNFARPTESHEAAAPPVTESAAASLTEGA